MYAWEDGSPHAGTSIFTPDNLRAICALEHVLLDTARYREFCVLPFNATSASECKAPSGSVAYQFYANAKQVSTGGWRNCTLLGQHEITPFAEKVVSNIRSDATGLVAAKYGWMMASDVASQNQSSRTRSFINFGTPLDGFVSEQDRPLVQRAINKAFFSDISGDLFAKVSVLLCTVTFHANLAHSLTCSP